jgi:hypothetical protein
MGGYDFPGQIEVSDGSEDYGVIGTDFITLGNSVSTGSIRVDERGGYGLDEDGNVRSTRSFDWGERDRELIVDNQSILREISRWVGEGAELS